MFSPKKILLIVGGLLFLGVVGSSTISNTSQQSSVLGTGNTQNAPKVIQQTIIPAFATDTPTPLPTNTPTPVPPTPTEYIVPTVRPTQQVVPTTTSQTGLDNNNYYTNSSGNTVHSPANSTDGSVPKDASAKCKDGSYSFSQHRSGTCSGHGGVSQWL